MQCPRCESDDYYMVFEEPEYVFNYELRAPKYQAEDDDYLDEYSRPWHDGEQKEIDEVWQSGKRASEYDLINTVGPFVEKPSDRQVGGNHYKNMAIQPTEFCQRNKLSFCEANIIKYACRHGFKNGREDVEKIIHYAQLLLEFNYPEE